MPTLKDLEKSAETIFQKVEGLQEQLRNIPNARSTFSIENGMEYCTNAELGKMLARAAQKSPSLRGNQASAHIETLAQVLEKIMKNLQECEQVIGRAMRKQSWSPNLEEELSVNWRLFCMHFHDASAMLDVAGLDLSMLIGKPEASMSKKNDPDNRSVSTATDQTWHSKGSFIRLFQSRNQHKRNKLSKQQTGSSQPQVPRLSVPNLPDNSDAVSDPGVSPAAGIHKDSKYCNPSIRSASPPPRYSDVGFASNEKVDSPKVQEVKTVQPAPSQDHQGPLSRFSTRFDVVPPSQPGNQTFIAEHIHMYHGCPPTQYPGGMLPGPTHTTGAWQPVWQPALPARPPPPGPPLLVPPPLSYKSSAFSLRETLATEFLDLIKPDATCVHGIRHHKSHTSCGWGCCWQRGCFGRY